MVLPKILSTYRKSFEDAAKGPRERSGPLEILGLPLLAHLALRLLAERPDAAEMLLADTTTLYRCLVDLVVAQAAKPEEAAVEGSAMLKGEELRPLLRGTAEAMTTFMAESIPYDELAMRLGLKGSQLRQRVDRLSGEQVLSRLMISFFFKGGRTELGAEFSHKSFREYLFAEQIVEVVKSYGRDAKSGLPERTEEEYWKDFDEGDPRRALCHRLAELLGPVWLTPEVSGHLRRLLEWEIERASELDQVRIGTSTSPLKLEEWERVRDGLADAWDWWGEGVHLRPQPTLNEDDLWEYKNKDLALKMVEKGRLRSDHKQHPIPARTTSIDAHFGDGLFLLTATTHSVLAFIGLADTLQPWKFTSGQAAARRYQHRLAVKPHAVLVFSPSGPQNRYFFNYCARINAGGYRPGGSFPAGADLSAAYLGWAYLDGADFRESNLRAACLSETFLRGADLSLTDLRGADLDGTCLRGADLSGADLTRTDLFNADLSGADLRGADLSGVDLSGINLKSALYTPELLKVATLDDDVESGDPDAS
jgi:hypothetical protein